MLIPGIVSATFRDQSPEDIIRLCVSNRLIGVEWSENAHILPNDEKGAELLKSKTLAAGLKVAAYGSYYRLGTSENPEKDFLPSLVSAHALGAPLMRVWAGTIPSAKASQEYAVSLAHEAAVIAEMAAKKNVKIAFEWHKNSLTDTNESAMQLLKQANHPNLYCLWQPTVALSETKRSEGLDLLGDRLLNLHVYYWLEGKRRPLSEGIGYWNTYLAHVNPQEDRFALLEFVMNNTEEQFHDDAAALHQIISHYKGE